MRNIETYRGKKIGKKQLKKIKKIAVLSLKGSKLQKKYKRIYKLEDIQERMFFNDFDEYLVLGNDWFLTYNIEDNLVRISNWMAVDDKNTKLTQSIEMLNTIKELLINNKDKKFVANFRHNTSYPLYKKMLDKDYFKENFHHIDKVSCPASVELRLKFLEMYSPCNYEIFLKYLKSEAAIKNPDDLEYIIHCIVFKVTNEFIEKYDTKEKKYTL